MYGLAVNLIVSVSGHPWIIDEIIQKQSQPKLKGQTLQVYKILYLDFLCQLLPRMFEARMSMLHPYFLANLEHIMIRKLYMKKN